MYVTCSNLQIQRRCKASAYNTFSGDSLCRERIIVSNATRNTLNGWLTCTASCEIVARESHNVAPSVVSYT